MGGTITFFVDRSIGGKTTVAPTLRSHEDLRVILHDEVFPNSKTTDVQWLTHAGREGWWVLTRDKEIRRHTIELKAVARAKVGMFVIVGVNITGPEMALAFERSLPKLKAFIRRHERPFIAKVFRDGTVKLWWKT